MTPEQELEKMAEIAEDPESVLFDHIQETESKFGEMDDKLEHLDEIDNDLEDLDERLKEEAKKNLVLNLEMAKEELSDVSEKIEEQTKLMVENNRDKTKHLQICQYLETIKELLKKEARDDYSEIIKAINKVSDRIKDPKETKIDLNPVLDQLKSFKKVIKDDRVKVEIYDKQLDRLIRALSNIPAGSSGRLFDYRGVEYTTSNPIPVSLTGGSVTVDTSSLATSAIQTNGTQKTKVIDSAGTIQDWVMPEGQEASANSMPMVLSTEQEAILSAINTGISNVLSSVTTYALQYAFDSGDSTITYVGKAVAGSTLASASWQIKQITDTSGDLSILFADGDVLFNNVWNNRESLTYS